MSTETVIAPGQGPVASDEMPLLGIDHIELFVGNATQAAYWFTRALGFRETAYAGLETGIRDRSSHVLEQGRVRIVLTAPLLGTSEIARHVAAHGDGVRTIALRVPDAEHAYRYAVQHGALGVREPWEATDDNGAVRMATIATYGETLHTFVERNGYEGAFLPGYERRDPGPDAGHVRRRRPRRRQRRARPPRRVGRLLRAGLRDDGDDPLHRPRHLDRVLGADVEGDGRRQGPGQVSDQRAGRGPAQVADRGVPRVLRRPRRPAHRARDAPTSSPPCASSRERGIRFIKTPASYYEELPGRIGEIDEDLADLRELGILADRDDEGYLLQIFSQNIGDRPTVFLEVIERHGARGFGEGNFKALFEAIEREQDARGNL